MTTANDIINLLLKKHSDWICVPECKTGSSWVDKSVRRLDLWAMAKSWTKPRSIGYEVKVSRSDFLKDDKWRSYLDYCSEFYFVAPPGIIDPDELPPEAGLLVCSKNAKMLYTKKKAPARSVEIPENLYKYIMMWRCAITDEKQHLHDRSKEWAAWLAQKDESKMLGHNVSKSIRALVNQRIKKVELENKRLSRENYKLQEIKAFLDKVGISLGGFMVINRLEDKLKEIELGVPEGLINTIDVATNNLLLASKILKRSE